MKKRILSLLLCVTMLLTFLPQTVLFASADDSGTCGTNLRWSYNSSTYKLTITGSGAMTNWNYYDNAPWYSYRSSIKSVSLPDGLTSIGSYAFYGCSGLTAISIPDSVTSIGDRALCECIRLTSITIGNGVTSIGNYAFVGCTRLTAIAIPDSVTSIGYDAFHDCTGLTRVTIGNGVTSIGSSAFWNCTGLTAISIPDSVTSIGYEAFYNCTGLTRVTIGNGVTSIGSCTFYDCTGLTSITIPNSVTSIGWGAFYGCTGLTSVTIGNGVTSIGYDAFLGCSGLTSITIPDSVTSIGGSAFSGCTRLSHIHFLGREPSIGIDAFSSCASDLTLCYLPGTTGGWEYYTPYPAEKWYCTVTTDCTSITYTCNTCGEAYTVLTWCFDETTGKLTIIDTGVMTNWSNDSYAPWYSYRSSIKSVSLPDGLTSIGDYAFYGCTGLTAISIPDSVTSIGEYAFKGCSELTAISIPDSVRSIGDYAFYGCTGLTAISIPDSVTSIGNGAFMDCTGLTAISIPDSVTSIGDCAFEYCTGLTAITIPDSVTSIGWGAFYGCTGLTAITIPDSVTSIGGWAFKSCSGLTSITVAEGNPVYDSRNNCNAIIETATNTLIAGCKNTVIPDSVTSIGNAAFNGCTGLTAISIPDGVTYIGEHAFEGCTGLTSITIGNGVRIIGELAFYYCTGLTAISIPDSVTSIGLCAFLDCTGLTDVYYPGTVKEWIAIYIDDGNDPLGNATIHFGQTEADPCEDYTDINRSSWYHSAADFVITRGLMGSTKTNALTFEPNTKVSRAMVASILYRMANSPATKYKATFTDVPDGKWFTTAIEWCAQNGLASGKGDGKFDPNGNVTRQELAVFMKKMAEYLGKDTSGRADLGSFADGTSVPAWARTYAQWAVSAGLISGKANGGKTYLAPTDTATRAEFASIIMRFVQNIAEAK